MESRLRLSALRCAALSVMMAFAAVLSGPEAAQAAVGDPVAAVEFDTACPSGIGVGIGFDGVNLWLSCTVFSDRILEGANDLYRATTAGAVTAQYKINTVDDTGIGALAYDAGRNGIWVGWGNAGGGASLGNVWFVSLDAGKNVVTSAVVGNIAAEPGLLVFRLDDGLAYDGQAVVQPKDEEAGLCGYIANHGRGYDVLPRIQGNEPDVPQAGPAPRIAPTDPDAVSACIVGQCADARVIDGVDLVLRGHCSCRGGPVEIVGAFQDLVAEDGAAEPQVDSIEGDAYADAARAGGVEFNRSYGISDRRLGGLGTGEHRRERHHHTQSCAP